MIEPTIENLHKYAADPVARWLIAAAKKRHTLTYGEAKDRLEKAYGFSKIFPTMMGHPAGHAMNTILAFDNSLPPLNVLLVRQHDGMPSDGAGHYMAQYFGKPSLREKDARTKHPAIWRDYFERAAEDVYNYKHWEDVYQHIYGRQYRPDRKIARLQASNGGTEKDGLRGGRRGEGENHKALRLWVLDNAQRLFRNINLIDSKTEVDLLSGDRVDVVYYAADRTIAVEVKSRDSNDADLQRGIYQCVKYRAVLDVMDPRSDAQIAAALVTETPLPGYLKDLAKRLGVRHIEAPARRGHR